MFYQTRRALKNLGVVRTGALDGVHLTVANQRGSVQHFYHFLLGFLVPLVLAWSEVSAKARGRPVYVRSCALMDPILLALRRDGLTILPANTHKALRQGGNASARLGHRLDHVTVPGFDWQPTYDRDKFLTACRVLFQWLDTEITAERTTVAAMSGGQGPRILLIDRLPSDPFYLSPDSESKGSGSQRRSIPNMVELVALARTRSGNVVMTTLENRGLPFQMALFESADIIICQHGAALANLLWARAGARVIEIIPEGFARDAHKSGIFEGLAACLHLHYAALVQPEEHGPVAADGLARLLDQAVSAG